MMPKRSPEAVGGTNLGQDLDGVSLLRRRVRVAAGALKWSEVGNILTR